MRRVILGLGMALVMGAMPVFAHPHVFVNNRTTVVFDQGMLQGIDFTWTFDEMFSNMILTDYDPNHTFQFDAARAKALKAGAFDNLENYHYFIALVVGKKAVSHFTIEQFSPSVADQTKLVYSFFIPLKIPVESSESTVRLTVYDDSYYVAFDLLHLSDVTVKAGADVACDLAIEKTKVKPLWPGQYMPDQLVIRFKRSS